MKFGDREDAVTLKLDMMSALKQLPTRQRAVVAMYCEGYTQQDIGKLLRVSRTTICADAKEAFKTLRDLMG